MIADKATTITVNMDRVTCLREIAREMGFVAERGRHAGEGCLARFLDAIAGGQVRIIKPCAS